MGSGCCGSEKPPIVHSSEKPSTPPQPKRSVRSVVRLPDPSPPPSPKFIRPVRSSGVKPPDRPEIFLEDFIIVWLHPSASLNPAKIQKIQTKFQGVLKDVVLCTDPDQCQRFMDDVKDEKIFLVVSEPMMNDFVPEEQNASKIEATYYLRAEEGKDDDEEENEEQAGEENDEINEQDDEPSNERHGGTAPSSTPLSSTAVCSQLKKAVKNGVHNLMKPQVIKNEKERIRFMYNQLFRDIILDTKEENDDGFISFCEKNYEKEEIDSDNSHDLRSTYSKAKAIYWYTIDGCLYRMVNKALRTYECEMLYELRPFIRHVHERIVAKQPKQADWQGMKLYRGQVMDPTDFKDMRENIGGFTFFPNFLSTSSNPKRAMHFIRISCQDSANIGKVKVLFKIIVKNKIHSPFADIMDESAYKKEKEWLFSLGSVFCIGDIKESDHHRIQHVTLTSIEYNDEELTTLKEHYRKLVTDENVYLSFGRLLYQMAEWEKSKKTYTKGREKEKDPYRREAIQNNLELIELKSEKNPKALLGYGEFLSIKSDGDPSHRHRAVTYNNIATVYYKDKKLDSAAKNLRLAIQTYNDQPNGDLSFIGTVYNNMACILNSDGKHEQALVNNEKCLGIRQVLLPETHPDLAIAYNSIAITYRYLWLSSESKGYSAKAKEHAEKALEYAKKAVEIDKISVPPEHPQVKIHEINHKYLIKEARKAFRLIN